jgi:hypothetical protein
VPVDVVSVGRLAMLNLLFLSPERFGIRAVPKGAKIPTLQYNADLVNPSSGKINLGKLKSRKQSDLFSLAKILFLLFGGYAN